MGAWGTTLYSDDTTCEVRDTYIENLQRGLTDKQAYMRILDDYADLLDDHDVACLVYFALADTAWKFGRLHKTVKSRALELIGQGGDVPIWARDAPEEAPKRKRALRALEMRLLSKQPARKLIKESKPKPKRILTTAPLGSVFVMNLPSGYKALFVLVGFYDGEKSVEPYFSVVNWRGNETPSQKEVRKISQKTLKFSSELGKKAHLGGADWTGLMPNLVATERCVSSQLPYNPEDAISKNFEAIAEEIDAHFTRRNC